MSKLIQKRKLCISMLSILLVLLFQIQNFTVSAHEIFYDGSTGIALKWYNVTNRVAYININGDKLDSNYSSHYSTIRYAWSNASARVSITQSNFSSSNVDLEQQPVPHGLKSLVNGMLIQFLLFANLLPPMEFYLTPLPMQKVLREKLNTQVFFLIQAF